MTSSIRERNKCVHDFFWDVFRLLTHNNKWNRHKRKQHHAPVDASLTVIKRDRRRRLISGDFGDQLEWTTWNAMKSPDEVPWRCVSKHFISLVNASKAAVSNTRPDYIRSLLHTWAVVIHVKFKKKLLAFVHSPSSLQRVTMGWLRQRTRCACNHV